MTRKDHQLIFTAMGFLAVILREDTAQDKLANRATGLANLIESFCANAIPNAFADETASPEIEQHLDFYLAQLRNTGAATPSFDRATLLKMHELLTLQKIRADQQHLPADTIAENIQHLAQEKILRDAAQT